MKWIANGGSGRLVDRLGTRAGPRRWGSQQRERSWRPSQLLRYRFFQLHCAFHLRSDGSILRLGWQTRDESQLDEVAIETRVLR